jgi:high-affinity Fe2+/Pb2+ permease
VVVVVLVVVVYVDLDLDAPVSMVVVGGSVKNEVTEALEQVLFGCADLCVSCGCWSSDDNDTLVGLFLTGLVVASERDDVVVLWVVLEFVVIVLVVIPLSMVARR